MVDEALQHHHQAPRPLAERAVRVLLQEGEQLRPDLGQHGGHVVSRQRVAVVQIHHGVLQVAARREDGKQSVRSQRAAAARGELCVWTREAAAGGEVASCLNVRRRPRSPTWLPARCVNVRSVCSLRN